jgi:tRNA U55 pseudouridine synthase TruB
LRRTRIGPFDVDAALTLPAERGAHRDAVRARLIPIDAMPLALPSLSLASALDVVRFAAGGVIGISQKLGLDPSLAAVRDETGRLLGVGELTQESLAPRLVLPRP